EGLGGAMALIRAAGQEQVLELGEGDDDRDVEPAKDLHDGLEKDEDEVLARRLNLEIELGKTEGEKDGQLGVVTEEDRAAEALVDVSAHEAGSVVGLGLLDILAQGVAGVLDGKADFFAAAEYGAGRGLCGAAELFVEPLGAFLGLRATQPE